MINENFDYEYIPRVVSNRVQMAVMQGLDIPTQEVDKAVGYLSNWASQMYKTCVISHDGLEGDIIALFWKGEQLPGRPDYTIGAIWRKIGNEKSPSYSFHS